MILLNRVAYDLGGLGRIVLCVLHFGGGVHMCMLVRCLVPFVLLEMR